MLPVLRTLDVDRFLDEIFYNPHPSYKIKEDEDKIRVAIEMPGVNKNDLVVSVDNNVLKVEAKIENWHKNYTHKKEFNLGAEIDQDKIYAKYENGILEITLGKTEKSKKKVVKIE